MLYVYTIPLPPCNTLVIAIVFEIMPELGLTLVELAINADVYHSSLVLIYQDIGNLDQSSVTNKDFLPNCSCRAAEIVSTQKFYCFPLESLTFFCQIPFL